jgi:hypothetical protein
VAGAEPSHRQRERDETKHCSFRRLGNAAGLASRVPAPGRAPGSASAERIQIESSDPVKPGSGRQ